MSRTETVIFTNMCMISDSRGNVLIQDRVDPAWPGISFPGGHVETGESFTDAVIREVFEETGLTVSRLQMCGIKDWIREDGIRYVVLLYKTDTFSGIPASSCEGEIRWVPLDTLSGLKLAEGMDTMLKVFLQKELSEQFFFLQEGNWIEVLK